MHIFFPNIAFLILVLYYLLPLVSKVQKSLLEHVEFRWLHQTHSTHMLGEYDIAVIGGGIVGLGVAQEITNRTSKLKVHALDHFYELIHVINLIFSFNS